MSATRSNPLTALALAVGLMAHGTTSAQDHSQHQMPAVQDHSQHQPAKKPAAKKKAKAPVAAKPASTSNAGHAAHPTPAAAKAPAKAVAKPAKKKAATPASSPHAGHGGAPVARPDAKPAASKSGTGDKPDPPFMLLSGLWEVATPRRAIRAISRLVTVIAWCRIMSGPKIPACSSAVSVVLPSFF